MELVELFKDEVNSIADHRPPVSKAKMAQITRAAIKATRFYKHVVMAVERFIERCSPEYKIAGLYVIDSIVRQSRHINGKSHDIFGPRFSENMLITFENLFSGCLTEDKPRIVRVLNLWQKNGVFNAKTIQPLLDMASTIGSGSEGYAPVSTIESGSQGFTSGTTTESGSLGFPLGSTGESGSQSFPARSITESSSQGFTLRSTPESSSQAISSGLTTETTSQVFETRSTTESISQGYAARSSSETNSQGFASRSTSDSCSQEYTSKSTTDSTAEAERKRKCFPKIRDRHLTVCSSTLWLGHVPKSVTEADISDAFGEYGTINSIDLIPPRGCAYVCMDRRQDAKKALSESRDLKLKGTRIKMAWAPGKGLKEYKTLKEYFELSIGCAYIPHSKIDSQIDLDTLEEGGVIDEDSMSVNMIETRERRAKEKLQQNLPKSTQNVNTPIMSMLTQTPSYPSLPPTVPPPPAWIHSQPGIGIPFPPPPLTSTSATNLIQPSTHDSKKIKLDNDTIDPPVTIDQKISMTEQQISIVEQQLNMMQQSLGLPSASLPGSGAIPPLSFVTNTSLMPQTNPFDPMIFDLAPPGVSMLPQHPLFVTGALVNPAIPITQANLDPSLDGSQNYSRRY